MIRNYDRIYDPAQVTHPQLHEFAVKAAWITVLEETAQQLAELTSDLPPDKPGLPDVGTRWPWEFDAVSVALAVLQAHREEVESDFADQLAMWVAETPGNAAGLRVTLLMPWWERPGILSEDTPTWIRTLGSFGGPPRTTTHFGRRLQ